MKRSKALRTQIIMICIAAVLSSAGCAAGPRCGLMAVTSINGVRYVSVPEFCDMRNVAQSFDPLTNVVSLTAESHNARFLVGDTFALVDGKKVVLPHPVELKEGKPFIPDKFRQQILEDLFFKKPAAVKGNK